MKMIRNLRLMLMPLAVSAILTGVANAGTPVERSADVSVGSVTYTNAENYVVLQVEKIELFKLDPATATATVKRVSSESLTNLLGTIVVTGGYGQSTNSAFYLFRGDKIVTTGAGTNTGTQRITGNIQP